MKNDPLNSSMKGQQNASSMSPLLAGAEGIWDDFETGSLSAQSINDAIGDDIEINLEEILQTNPTGTKGRKEDSLLKPFHDSFSTMDTGELTDDMFDIYDDENGHEYDDVKQIIANMSIIHVESEPNRPNHDIECACAPSVASRKRRFLEASGQIERFFDDRCESNQQGLSTFMMDPYAPKNIFREDKTPPLKLLVGTLPTAAVVEFGSNGDDRNQDSAVGKIPIINEAASSSIGDEIEALTPRMASYSIASPGDDTREGYSNKRLRLQSSHNDDESIAVVRCGETAAVVQGNDTKTKGGTQQQPPPPTTTTTPPSGDAVSLMIMARLDQLMKQSTLSQAALQEMDRLNGLPRSHCQTMVNTSRSRKQLQLGKILPKWNGEPLLDVEGGVSTRPSRKKQTPKKTRTSTTNKAKAKKKATRNNSLQE